MSEPFVFPQATLAFEDFFNADDVGAGHQPSPIFQSAFPAFQSGPETSPYYDGIHKTPGLVQVRVGHTDGYLVSDGSHSSSSSSTLDGSSGASQTPTQSFHPRGKVAAMPMQYIKPELPLNWGNSETYQQYVGDYDHNLPMHSIPMSTNSTAAIDNDHYDPGVCGHPVIPDSDFFQSSDNLLSSMTTSAPYGYVMPANTVTYHQGHSMVPSLSLPVLGRSQQPSPDLSMGTSLPLTPSHSAHGVYPSSDLGQDFLKTQSGQEAFNYFLNALVTSAPGSSSMPATASFPYGQSVPMGQSTSLPTQPTLYAQKMFEPVTYPAVPYAYQHTGPPVSSTARPEDLNVWHTLHHQMPPASDESTYANVQPFPIAGLPRRKASAPAQIYGWNPPTEPAVRSFSAPSGSTAPHEFNMPAALATGGLFGPAQPAESSRFAQMAQTGFEDCPNLPPYRNKRRLENPSPDMPIKRQTHPRVGLPLKPGPRAKKTDGKGKSKSTDSPTDDVLDPSLFEFAYDTAFTPDSVCGDESPPLNVAPFNLVFGGDLKIDDCKPTGKQVVHGVYTFGEGIPVLSAIPGGQPRLIFQPERPAVADGEVKPGLPKAFLELLYVARLSLKDGNTVRDFHCLIEGCGRTFPRKSAITSHLQTHLEDKPFKCERGICESAFVRQHDLRRHDRIHEGVKTFTCQCQKEFARGDALSRHRQRGICVGGTGPKSVSQGRK